MKLLFVHPNDSPVEGPWSQTRWDYVIDLGWAGEPTYGEWGLRMGCPVRGFYSFAQGPDDFRRIADILRPCLGTLVDEQGLDWWDILAPMRAEELLQLVLTKRVALEVGSAELVGTHHHPLAELYARAAGRKIQFVAARRDSAWGRQFRRFRNAARVLSPSQLVQASLDKWDMDYRLRARWTLSGRRESDGAVLLPSGYTNVTRILNAYASLLPEQKFLLVTTRRDGEMRRLGKNVRSAPLAGFAAVALSDSTGREVRSLEERWGRLQEGPLRDSSELSLAKDSGWFNDIGKTFERWLRIRDAWRNVLQLARISAVLCGDENNCTNRIPALLARRQKLPTVHCHHGALSVLLPLRVPACDTDLVKGAMENDFMTRMLSIDPSRIVQGAPPDVFPGGSASIRQTGSSFGPIVFFSEQHELTLARMQILYQELLPPLCAIARSHGTRVIVKLHPFESPASRRRLLKAVLSAMERDVVDLVHGPLTEELLRNIWFSVTVESSVCVDCAIRGIPCFVCSWFVTPIAGYEKQFLRYGAAYSLTCPAEILRIPSVVKDLRITPEVQQGLWNPIAPAKLDALLRKP
jgi:hypothetical protein